MDDPSSSSLKFENHWEKNVQEALEDPAAILARDFPLRHPASDLFVALGAFCAGRRAGHRWSPGWAAPVRHTIPVRKKPQLPAEVWATMDTGHAADESFFLDYHTRFQEWPRGARESTKRDYLENIAKRSSWKTNIDWQEIYKNFPFPYLKL